MKVKVYENEKGDWSFHDGPGCREVVAELAFGYRIAHDHGGNPGVSKMGEPAGIPIEDAIRRGILHVPWLK